jgi:hypothetical protein
MPPVEEAQQVPDARPLAREMAAALQEMLESYQTSCGLSPQEAVAKVNEPPSPEYVELLLRTPPDQLSWCHMDALAKRDPALVVRCWERLKQAARAELRSGHRAAKAVEEYASTPWKRAEFLAFREELTQGWQPRNGIERQLIDQMAQAQVAILFWQRALTWRASMGILSQERSSKGEREPRVSEAEAADQAAAMVDRYNRIYLRTLRALHDLRRRPPAVVVQNVGQMNVGEQVARQVNMAG